MQKDKPVGLECAISIESRSAYGAEYRPITKIWEEDKNGVHYTYYRDSEGAIWYRSSCGADIDARIAARKRDRRLHGSGETWKEWYA